MDVWNDVKQNKTVVRLILSSSIMCAEDKKQYENSLQTSVSDELIRIRKTSE